MYVCSSICVWVCIHMRVWPRFYTALLLLLLFLVRLLLSAHNIFYQCTMYFIHTIEILLRYWCGYTLRLLPGRLITIRFVYLMYTNETFLRCFVLYILKPLPPSERQKICSFLIYRYQYLYTKKKNSAAWWSVTQRYYAYNSLHQQNHIPI